MPVKPAGPAVKHPAMAQQGQRVISTQFNKQRMVPQQKAPLHPAMAQQKSNSFLKMPPKNHVMNGQWQFNAWDEYDSEDFADIQEIIEAQEDIQD